MQAQAKERTRRLETRNERRKEAPAGARRKPSTPASPPKPAGRGSASPDVIVVSPACDQAHGGNATASAAAQAAKVARDAPTTLVVLTDDDDEDAEGEADVVVSAPRDEDFALRLLRAAVQEGLAEDQAVVRMLARACQPPPPQKTVSLPRSSCKTVPPQGEDVGSVPRRARQTALAQDADDVSMLHTACKAPPQDEDVLIVSPTAPEKAKGDGRRPSAPRTPDGGTRGQPPRQGASKRSSTQPPRNGTSKGSSTQTAGTGTTPGTRRHSPRTGTPGGSCGHHPREGTPAGGRDRRAPKRGRPQSPIPPESPAAHPAELVQQLAAFKRRCEEADAALAAILQDREDADQRVAARAAQEAQDAATAVLLEAEEKAEVAQEEEQRKQALADAREFPRWWDRSRPRDTVHLVNVLRGGEEWEDVVLQAQQAFGPRGERIRNIQRIQNAALWASYKANRDFLLNVKYDSAKVRVNSDAPGGGPVLEQRMWHGTKLGNPESIYKSSHGWCASFSNFGSLGRGSYFAYSPTYSMHGFCYANTRGELEILLADVLTGAIAAGPCHAPGAYGVHRTLGEATRPPDLQPTHEWHAYLRSKDIRHHADSVGSQAMCVVYAQSTALAYPRYLITFR